MGITSENVAERYGIGRQVQDEFALTSHTRAAEAKEKGLFKSQIVPVTIRTTNEETGEEISTVVDSDDGIRAGLTLEKLAKLKPAFKDDGASTAGNS